MPLLVTVAAAVHCHLHQPPPLPLLASPSVTHHGRPGADAATSVGGGGFGDLSNPVRACFDPRGAFPNRPRGLDGPHAGGALGTGNPILPGGASIGGGPGPHPGVDDNGRT